MATSHETCCLVIPAKAGIQFVKQYRAADKTILGVVPLRGVMSTVWIPAFAGMTEVRKICVMNYSKVNNT